MNLGFKSVFSPGTQKVHDPIAPAGESDEFSLSDIEGFPETQYLEQRKEYQVLFDWYEGKPLNDTVEAVNGDTVDRYPVKLNPIKGAVLKHTSAMLGEVSESRIPVYSKIKTRKKELREKAKEAEAFLDDVWKHNNGRSVQLRNSLFMPIYGGCVYGVSYLPDDKENPYRLKIYIVHPSNFIGILQQGDEYRLAEAWVVTPLSASDAKKKFGLNLSKDKEHYYVEHWTKTSYDITVDGKKIPLVVDGRELGYWGGKNPFGFVPFVYIPRTRTSRFLGESLITENVRGIVLELNRRVADIGDAVSDDAHSVTALIDAQGTPQLVEVAAGINVLMVKSEPNIAGGQNKANMQNIAKNSASTAMSSLTGELYEHFRREANIPAVADGEDEGSQRSSLTLQMRMWPLLSVTKTMRMNVGDALSILNYYILRMAEHAGVIEKLGDEFHANTTIEQRFHSVLPRDREVFIQELVSRAGSKLGSIDTLLSMLDDIDDIDEEKKKILDWLKELAEQQAALSQQNKPAPGTPGNQAKSVSNNSSEDKKKEEPTKKSNSDNDKGEKMSDETEGTGTDWEKAYKQLQANSQKAAEKKDAQLASLQEEVTGLKTQAKELQKSLTLKEAEAAKLQGDLDTVSADLTGKLEAKTSEVAELQGKLAGEEGKLSRAKIVMKYNLGDLEDEGLLPADSPDFEEKVKKIAEKFSAIADQREVDKRAGGKPADTGDAGGAGDASGDADEIYQKLVNTDPRSPEFAKLEAQYDALTTK